VWFGKPTHVACIKGNYYKWTGTHTGGYAVKTLFLCQSTLGQYIIFYIRTRSIIKKYYLESTREISIHSGTHYTAVVVIRVIVVVTKYYHIFFVYRDDNLITTSNYLSNCLCTHWQTDFNNIIIYRNLLVIYYYY